MTLTNKLLKEMADDYGAHLPVYAVLDSSTRIERMFEVRNVDTQDDDGEVALVIELGDEVTA